MLHQYKLKDRAHNISYTAHHVSESSYLKTVGTQPKPFSTGTKSKLFGGVTLFYTKGCEVKRMCINVLREQSIKKCLETVYKEKKKYK